MVIERARDTEERMNKRERKSGERKKEGRIAMGGGTNGDAVPGVKRGVCRKGKPGSRRQRWMKGWMGGGGGG